MKTNNGSLILVGLVGLIIGAVIGYLVFGPAKPLVDPGPAKYILMFGDPNGSTLVTANTSAFQTALASPAPNWSTLQEVPIPGAVPIPVPVPAASPAAPGTVLIAKIQLIQLGQNNSQTNMHVTQKVGLNDPAQVQRVLAALSPDATAANPEPTSTPH